MNKKMNSVKNKNGVHPKLQQTGKASYDENRKVPGNVINMIMQHSEMEK